MERGVYSWYSIPGTQFNSSQGPGLLWQDIFSLSQRCLGTTVPLQAK